MRHLRQFGLLLAFFTAGAWVLAQQPPPEEVKAAFENLRSLWRSSSTDGLARHFCKRVGLHLDNQTNENYSREQATEALRGYFQRTEVVRVENVEEEKRYRGGGGAWTATFKYEYRAGGDQEVRKRKLRLSIKSTGGAWLLDSALVTD